ncbi:unnamed protein product, partial [marine sediment metagenome]
DLNRKGLNWGSDYCKTPSNHNRKIFIFFYSKKETIPRIGREKDYISKDWRDAQKYLQIIR